jgi:putative MATE family efflux protein
MSRPENNTGKMSGESRINLLEGNLYRTIIRLGYPMALASVVQTLYNLADTFWLGRLGRQALAAPIISFNILFFIISLAIGFSVAGTSLVSQYTGAKKPDQANKVAGNLLVFFAVFSLVFSAVGYFSAEFLLKLLATPPEAMGNTLSYFRVMILGMPLAFPFFVYQSVLHGYGDTKSPLKVELISAGINVVLDPILIFGWLGMPALGVTGAALTTVISRAVASLVGVRQLFSGDKGIKIKQRHLKPDFSLVPLMIRVGFPAAIGMAGASLGFMVLIGIVNQFGTAVVGAYGIATRVVHVFMMPAIGISSAVTAIVGQNLGAGLIARAKKVVGRGLRLALVVIVPSMILVAFFGKSVTMFFIPDDPLVHRVGNTMFYFIAPAVVFFAMGVIVNGAFQGSGRTLPVMAANLARIWLFRIPLVYLVSFVILRGPLDLDASLGIWMGMFLSNLFSFLFIFILYLRGQWARSRIQP